MQFSTPGIQPPGPHTGAHACAHTHIGPAMVVQEPGVLAAEEAEVSPSPAAICQHRQHVRPYGKHAGDSVLGRMLETWTLYELCETVLPVRHGGACP